MTSTTEARSSSATLSNDSSKLLPTASTPWLAIRTAGPVPRAPTVPRAILFVPGRAYGAHGTTPKDVGRLTRAAAQIEAAT